MADKLVIVVGTGRCGSLSVSQLLSGCKGVFVSHEHIGAVPHSVTREGVSKVKSFVRNLMKSHYDVVGDVGFMWLPYLSVVKRLVNDVKIVVVTRDKELVVNSYLACWGDNDLLSYDCSHSLDVCFPKFSEEVSTRDRLYRYVAYYFNYLFYDSKRNNYSYESFDIEELNTFSGQEKLFVYCGIDINSRVYPDKPIVANVRAGGRIK